MAKIKFTKTELKRQRDQLKQFTRFLPTLQLKKQQLQLEIRLCAERIAANERKEQEAVARLAEWTMLFGDADAAAVIAAKLRIRKVNREYENIAGVNVPVYHSTDFELEPYDLFSAEPWIDDGVEAVNDAGVDAYFPILRRVTTLAEALDRRTAAANLAATVEQAFRLLRQDR